MRQKLAIGLVLLAFSGLAHAQSEAKRARFRTNTWAFGQVPWGMSADATDGGPFEMTIEKDKDGAPAGKVVVSGGESAHTAVFKSLSFEGGKMTGSYVYPLGDGGDRAGGHASTRARAPGHGSCILKARQRRSLRGATGR